MKVAVIDYEVGNLANVYNAWKRLGVAVDITRDPAVIRNADFIELPGVGAIRDAMANLQKFDLIPVLNEQVKAGKFFMGVCLGMQALFEKDYEGGEYDCLGFLPGDIVPFRTTLKVPHMGWNELEFRGSHWLQKGFRPIPTCNLSIPIISRLPIRLTSSLRPITDRPCRLSAAGTTSWDFSSIPKRERPRRRAALQNVIAYVQEKG